MASFEDEDSLDGVEVHPEKTLHILHEKLVQACLNKDLSEVKAILDDADVTTVKTLLSRDTSTHMPQNVRDTVIQTALTINNMELLTYLIHLDGCNLEQACSDTGTPLMYACQLDNVHAIQLLLESGANPNNSTPHASPVMFAASFASAEAVSLLLAFGADITVGPSGRRVKDTSLAFYMACLRGNLAIAEVFISAIKNKNLLSEQQLVLCHTLLGLQLIQQPNHAAVGRSLWQKALSWFNALMKPRFGELSKIQLSHALHGLYLSESALVQSGKVIEINDHTMLERTRSRFPDFRLCVVPDDVNENISANSDVLKIHDIIVKGCVSEIGPWWAKASLTLYDAVASISGSEMTVENKRLSLLILLENALLIGQPLQVMAVNCSILLLTVLKCRLYVDNPGYVMLLMDCSIEAAQSTFQLWSSDYMAEKRKEQKDVISVAYRQTAQALMSLAFIVLCTYSHESHFSHLLKLLKDFAILCKKVQHLEPSICLEYTMLCMVLSYMLKRDPLKLREHHGYENLAGTLLDLVQLLLCDCKLDVNARDENGNTVMFTAVKIDEPYRSDTIELLMSYGAHVDVSNYHGQSAYKILSSLPDNNIDLLDCRTLKCRAATVLSYFKIPYTDVLPPTLVKFVDMHDTYTPTAPFS